MDIKIERKMKEGLRDYLFGEESAAIQTKGKIGKHFMQTDFLIHIPITVLPGKKCNLLFFFLLGIATCFFLRYHSETAFFSICVLFSPQSVFGVENLRSRVAEMLFMSLKACVSHFSPENKNARGFLMFWRLGRLQSKGSNYMSHLNPLIDSY